MTTVIDPSPAERTVRPERRAGGADLRHALLRTDASAAQALVRVTLGLVIWPHGAQHLLGWFGGYGFAGTVEWMVSVGFPAPLAALAIAVEFFAPLALIVGFGGRVAGVGIAGLMLGAASTHVSNGFFMNWFGALPAGAEGFEYHLLALAMALAVAIGGSGAWSADGALTRRATLSGSGLRRVDGRRRAARGGAGRYVPDPSGAARARYGR